MYIVVDIGGTNTRVAFSRNGKTILKKKRFSTPRSYKKGIGKIVEIIKQLTAQKKLDGITIGIPGTLDRNINKTITLPHLPDWNNRNICQRLTSELTTKTTMANDAELAALGEAVFGAGRKYRIVGYLTISTGIGGSLVIDKILVPRAYTSEPGHMMMSLKGIYHNEGSRSAKDWEARGSGKAFEKRFGISPEECDDPKLWYQQAQILGQGVVSVILIWSPEILVIGGGLSRKGDLLFDPLRQFIKKHLTVFPPPPIIPAKLGDDAGLYGGLALIKSKK
jgi:glucokinase